MPRELTSGHEELIAGGHCEEITTVILTRAGGPAKAFTVDVSTNVFTSNAHGLTNGVLVMLDAPPGYFLPKVGNFHLEPETAYYVRDVTANTFKLAGEAGGSALDITWPGSGEMTFRPVTVVHMATSEVEHEDTLYVGHIHPTAGLKLTGTAASDRFAVEVQNADKAMGIAITGAESALDGALAVVGTIHKDLETDTTYYDPRLPGYVVGAQVDEATSTVVFSVVSDISEAEYAGNLVSEAFPQSDPAPALPLPIDDLRPPPDGPIHRPGDGREIGRLPWRFPDFILPEQIER